MQGIERGLQILEAIADNHPVGVGELARLLDLSKSSVQRNLQGLSAAGWIRPVGGEYTRWTLTARAITVGQRGSNEGRLREVAYELMAELREATDETITLQVQDGLRMVLIERVDSHQAVRNFVKLGAITPFHATAGGMAVLAHLTQAEQDKILSEPLEKLTPQTVVDPALIRAGFSKILRDGYAINLGQNRADVAAVGAAVIDSSGRRPVAGLGISMPASRFDEAKVRWWADQVRTTAASITASL